MRGYPLGPSLICSLVIAIAGESPPSAATQKTSQITALVYNLTDAPPAVVERAMKFVTVVYRSAGVTLQWMRCPSWRENKKRVDDCAHLLRPHEVVIRLVRPTPEWNSKVDSSVLGVALVADRQPGYYATVFYERVEDMSWAHGVTTDVTLGCAIAHELGHLLLKSHAHSHAGIMRKQFDHASQHEAEQGRLRLLSEEAAQVREEARIRYGAELNVPVARVRND